MNNLKVMEQVKVLVVSKMHHNINNKMSKDLVRELIQGKTQVLHQELLP